MVHSLLFEDQATYPKKTHTKSQSHAQPIIFVTGVFFLFFFFFLPAEIRCYITLCLYDLSFFVFVDIAWYAYSVLVYFIDRPR